MDDNNYIEKLFSGICNVSTQKVVT